MSHTSTYETPFKRRREQKTNYVKRMAFVKNSQPRLVVRKSNQHFVAEIMEYRPSGDQVKAFAHSQELKKLGWNKPTGNLPAAYLTGYLCAKKAMAHHCTQAILDIGLVTPVHGTRVFAALKGALDAGMQIPADPEVFPPQNRLQGAHISPQMPALFEQTIQAINQQKHAVKK
ncbi:MAG: 50S ribosomal protein L18 [Candidatus Diapherotrites archaeon]|nr:50S ribosomal protein L18 [Candidatus Diapherotrites archaeon]